MATLTPCSACGRKFNQGIGGIPKCPECGTSSNQFVVNALGMAFVGFLIIVAFAVVL